MAKTSNARRLKSNAAAVPPVSELKKDKNSRALKKGLQALEELAQNPGGLTLVEAAPRLGLQKASAFRVMRTLENLHYVTRTTEGKYLLSGASSRQLPIRGVQLMLQHGSEVLRGLMQEFRETVSMSALYENHIEVVMVYESPQLIRMSNTLGRILPPHGSSMGKAITAFLDRDKREHLLRAYGTPQLTPFTITDDVMLQQELEKIRSRGYAEDWEESTPGESVSASPILRPGGVSAGAVSISLPRMRLEGTKHQERLIHAVYDAAAEISAKAFGTEKAG